MFDENRQSMTTDELRTKLRQMIDQIENEQMLQAVYTILSQNKIVGHEVDGTPITKEQLAGEVDESDKEIDKGNYYKQEDIEKQARQR